MRALRTHSLARTREKRSKDRETDERSTISPLGVTDPLHAPHSLARSFLRSFARNARISLPFVSLSLSPWKESLSGLFLRSFALTRSLARRLIQEAAAAAATASANDRPSFRSIKSKRKKKLASFRRRVAVEQSRRTATPCVLHASARIISAAGGERNSRAFALHSLGERAQARIEDESSLHIYHTLLRKEILRNAFVFIPRDDERRHAINFAITFAS